MNHIIISEYQLATKLALVRGTVTPVYLLFTATKDENGSRWCPDCSSADPILEEAFEALPAGSQVIEVQIERNRWKGPEGKQHPFRSPPFSVRGIPTLIAWNAKDDKVTKRFTEGECEQMEMLQETFSAKV